jgi:hypothetical protein
MGSEDGHGQRTTGSSLAFVVTLISPSLFGLFTVPVNAVDHVIHVGVAVVSIALGSMARGRAPLAAR